MPDERDQPDPLERARQLDENFARRSQERERQLQFGLTSSLTFLTLMAAAAVQAGGDNAAGAAAQQNIRAAQFFLTVLAALVARYVIGALRGLAEGIADDAAEHHELEERDERVLPHEKRLNRQVAKLRQEGLVFRHFPHRLLAFIPRAGKSQREAVVLGAAVASIPAAWFALTTGRDVALDIVVVVLSAAAVLAWVRLLFAGAKHWVWVDPRCGKLVRLPSRDRPPKYWWRHRLKSAEVIERILEERGYERDEDQPEHWWSAACCHLYKTPKEPEVGQ